MIVEGQLSKISDLISLAQRKRALVSGLNILETTRQPVYGLILASDIASSSSSRLNARLITTTHSPEPSSVTQHEAPFLTPEARAWCEGDTEREAWCQDLISAWSSDRLGHLVGKASRVAVGFTEADLNTRLNREIHRISQVLVASSPR